MHVHMKCIDGENMTDTQLGLDFKSKHFYTYRNARAHFHLHQETIAKSKARQFLFKRNKE